MYIQNFDIDDLLDDLMSNDTEKVLVSAMELANIGKPVVQSLLELLDKSDERQTKIIAGVLTNIGEEAVNDMVKLLKSDNTQYRLMAATVLRDIGKAIIPLLISLLNDKKAETRAIAAEILGEVKDRESLNELKAHINDESEEVKIAVQSAISEIEKPFVSKVTESIKAAQKIEEIVSGLE